MRSIEDSARNRIERYGFSLDELPVTVLPAVANPVAFLSGEEQPETPQRTAQYFPVFDEIVVYERDFSNERQRRINSAAHEGIHRYFTEDSVSTPVPTEKTELGEAMHTIADAVAEDRADDDVAALLERTEDSGTALYPLYAAATEDNWTPLETVAQVALYDGDITDQIADCTTFTAVADTVDSETPVSDEAVEYYLEPVKQRLKEYALFHPEALVEAIGQFYTAYMYHESQNPDRRQHRYDVIDDAYDDAAAIKEHLSDAFTYYDAAEGTDHERANATFDHLRDQVQEEQRSATVRLPH